MDPMENLTLAAQALDNAAQRFDQFADEADAQVGAVAARHSGNSSSVFVDQAVGDDANAGTKEAPVATIQRAVDLSPVDKINLIYVRGDYTTTRRYNLDARKVGILAAVGDDWLSGISVTERPKLRISTGLTSTDFVMMFGFSINWDAVCNINGFAVELPSQAEIDALYPGVPTNTTLRALFNVATSSHEPIGTAVLRYGSLDMGEDPFPCLMSHHNGGRLYLHNLTIDGDLAGNIHPEVPAGTLRADAADHVITNLSTL